MAIIIDGVDVVGCEFLENGMCNAERDICGYTGTECNAIHMQDCYYKQLKCAESTIKECHKYQAQLEDRIDSLEQQNKELAEKVFLSEHNVMNTAATFCEKEEKISKLERENKIVKGMHDSINSRFDKLYKALQEIKEVAVLDDINCTISQETMNVSKDVLKIVSEVLDED